MGLKHKAEKIGRDKVEKLFDVIFALLQQKYGDKVTSSDGIKKLLTNFDEQKEKLLVDMLENANKSTLKKVSEVDWSLINYMIEYGSWLALLLEFDIEKEIKKCCPS